MVPAIRNILGGFLFSGDDVYKKAGVLSGGERTRLAVARMLLRPSNTLLLDEPTNHLDLDSKDVLLDALEDYGGTLIIVSHDRYFVEKLATKIIEIGHGEAVVYPGTYTEFLWHKSTRRQLPTPRRPQAKRSRTTQEPRARAQTKRPKPRAASDSRKRRETRPTTARRGNGWRPSGRSSSERPKPFRSASPTSKAGSPSARPRSRISRRRCPRPGSMRTAMRRNMSSSNIRR